MASASKATEQERKPVLFELEIPGSPFGLSIPNPSPITFATGSSLVFVGANGSGKTRLAMYIEETLADKAHRISAHRALILNSDVPKISEHNALAGLRTGNPDKNAEIGHRSKHRWQRKGAVALLSDFDFLVQALFAEQSNTALKTHRRASAGDVGTVDRTKFEQLVEIWQRLLPHRELHISGDSIQASIAGDVATYSAGEMSDGERAIFYLIAQVLVAAVDSVLIVDEPELHVHRAIMAKLWDELEAARSDCAFLFITHDIDFAASRNAQKFTIDEYHPGPWWKLRSIPDGTGFGENTATLILGSRVPVLFVEGTKTSLDFAIYRCCFPGWTVIPSGSCQQVIHAVITMRANAEFTRIKCAGLVDADDFAAEEKEVMSSRGIAVLPVSEIENLVLLPAVSRAIAISEGFVSHGLDECVNALASAVFESIKKEHIEDAIMRYGRRRIDRLLKHVKFDPVQSSDDFAARVKHALSAIDIKAVTEHARVKLEEAIAKKDLADFLARYDQKGLMAIAARQLRRSKRDDFEDWFTRVLLNGTAPGIVDAVRSVLPPLEAS